MTYTYTPRGTCSRQMKIEVNNGIIESFEAVGGCSGNLQGLSHLVKGMTVDETISRLKGIRCGGKSTSCPDQLAVALEAIRDKEQNG